MDIIRAGTRPSAKGPADWFTGTVRIDPLFNPHDPERVQGAQVTFEPGARTAWHTHPLGQTLLVVSGLGRVQREGIVIHLVAERITDLTPWLREVGELDLPRATMPGDGATHGGEIDPRDRPAPRQRPADSGPPRRSLKAPDLIPVRSRDFH